MFEKFKLRLKAYDMWLANIVTKGEFINHNTVTRPDTLTPNFAYVETANYFVKYFMVAGYPNYIQTNFLDELRVNCLAKGLKINYFQIGEPYNIDWSSPEMTNKIAAWKNYTSDVNNGVDIWNYGESKKEHDNKVRLIESTLYLNKAQIDQKRTTAYVQVYIQLLCEKGLAGAVTGNRAAAELVKQAKIMGIKLKSLKMNMIDWLKYISQFSRNRTKELNGKVASNIMTDDMIANLSGYKQGRIGDKGIPLGLDIKRREAVLYKFKEDPNKVENWLISAMTGGGKSYFIKAILMWLLGSGLTVTILDYEGDEYTDLFKIMVETDPSSAMLVSMGKGSAYYVDPMEIPGLVGDPDIDDDLKDTAIEYTLAMFRIIVHGANGTLTKWEESVINKAISNVYDMYQVTNDKNTWYRSKGIRIKDVYEEIVNLVDTKEFYDELTDNIQHKAAVEVAEACRAYFDDDGIRASAFKHPISLTDLREAQLVIFSFGVKGAVASTADQSILALKQLSVANISTQISNHSKYVKHDFNVKVWEEYQRYCDLESTAEIVGNILTGGRKRGDINFIVTNDIENILNDTKPINKQIRQSISTYAIGKIKDTDTIAEFCTKFKCKEVQDELMNLAATAGEKQLEKYKHAFCLMLDNGKKAIVRAELPASLSNSSLFSTGVKKK